MIGLTEPYVCCTGVIANLQCLVCALHAVESDSQPSCHTELEATAVACAYSIVARVASASVYPATFIGRLVNIGYAMMISQPWTVASMQTLVILLLLISL